MGEILFILDGDRTSECKKLFATPTSPAIRCTTYIHILTSSRKVRCPITSAPVPQPTQNIYATPLFGAGW